jgi:hypothetical protein
MHAHEHANTMAARDARKASLAIDAIFAPGRDQVNVKESHEGDAAIPRSAIARIESQHQSWQLLIRGAGKKRHFYRAILRGQKPCPGLHAAKPF